MATSFPYRLESPSGLHIELCRNGAIRRIDLGDILVSSFVGNELDGGVANVYLRRRNDRIEFIPLLGPRSVATLAIDESGARLRGSWGSLDFELCLVLSPTTPAWAWHLNASNRGDATEEIDVIYAQDLALAHYGAVRNNEYYVSHYVDFTPLEHPDHGIALAVRQNLPMGGRHPWAIAGSLRRGCGFTTDALAFHGLAARRGEPPIALTQPLLDSRRLQHEHALAVIQDTPIRLAPGGTTRTGFFVGLDHDHPAASAPSDVDGVAEIVRSLEVALPVAARAEKHAIVRSLPSASPVLVAVDLNEGELREFFPGPWRQEERDGAQLLSFFVNESEHVATRAKELRVLRPHGHIIRSGDSLAPDEASLSSTLWMHGVFHSLLTQGHCNINRFLSTIHGYLGVLPTGGLRIFADFGEGPVRLDEPSAFALTPNGARWIYKHSRGVLSVRSWAGVDEHALHLEIEALDGTPAHLLLLHHVALNGDDGATPIAARWERDAKGVKVRPIASCDVGWRFPDGYFRIDPMGDSTFDEVGGDERLFADGVSRDQPCVVIAVAPRQRLAVRITGHLLDVPLSERSADRDADAARADAFWRDVIARPVAEGPVDGAAGRAATRLAEILPWFAHNAMIHYLAPHGLEQYSGGGWGTRDVCQGPVELLLAGGKWDTLRQLLLLIFKNQNPGGDWPQWFMFFDRERNIRPPDSHGDIVYWPLLAVAEYLAATGDRSLLDANVPFFHPDGDTHAEAATMLEHIERALREIRAKVIPGTQLPAYGHGDWNDALQPVDPTMKEKLSSAWTTALEYQTLRALAEAYRAVTEADRAASLENTAAAVASDFAKVFLPNDLIAGYAYFRDDDGIDYLLHPSERVTGVHYSLLPMTQAILADLLSPEDARRHGDVIKQHLLAPDGARLFDRPFPYHGGTMERFQRAESSAYFGREMGVMYMHANLRYAEAMARLGDADAFFGALTRANPIGLRELVPASALRQSNCYYSSSDPAFPDRYKGSARYREVMEGKAPLEGGWRIYSSGAGIAVRLIQECFLGIRLGTNTLTIDPVMPKALDGLEVAIPLLGRTVRVTYRIAARGAGVTSVEIDRHSVPFSPTANPYRLGGAAIARPAFDSAAGMTIRLA